MKFVLIFAKNRTKVQLMKANKITIVESRTINLRGKDEGIYSRIQYGQGN